MSGTLSWVSGTLLVTVGLLAWRLLSRQEANRRNSPPPPAEQRNEGPQPSDQASVSERLHRRLRWLEQREADQFQTHHDLLGVVRKATNHVSQCSELAGDNQEMQILLDQTLDALHQVARGLRAELSPLGSLSVTEEDLCKGLADLAARVEDTSAVRIDVRIDPEIQQVVSAKHVPHILSVVREALANAMRHAGATQIALRTAVESQRLVFSISDDGNGFEADTGPKEPQTGLCHMQARAEAAGGLLQVESARGAGTIVTLTIPIPPGQRVKGA